MQKKLLAVAVLSAFSGLASAQSANVTMYGTLLGDVQMMGATGGDGTSINTNAAGAIPVGANSSFRNPAPTTAAAAATGNLGFSYLNSSAAALGSGIASPSTQASRMRMNPAGSNFGIRGTEDLGNGLSAWFQLELSATLGGPATFGGGSHGNAPSFRNSAVGLRSNTWGTALIGSWDLPFNVAYGRASTSGRAAVPGTTTSGSLMGNTFLGQGTVSSQDETVVCNAAAGVVSAASCFAFGTSFDRREKSTIQWWSPNWNGFEARVAYSAPGNFATADNRTTSGKIQPNIWDLSLGYVNGGLDIVYAYERQKDILAQAATATAGAVAATTAAFSSGVGNGAWTINNAPTNIALAAGQSAITGSQATGHRFGAKYAFSNGFAIGGLWESLTWNMTHSVVGVAAAGTAGNLTQIKKTAWKLGGSYTWANHFVGLDYYRANNLAGSIQSVTAVPVSAFDGSATGARQWIAMYNYLLSKRTSIGGYYNRVNNDTNASYGGQGFGATSAFAGQTATTYGLTVRHSF